MDIANELRERGVLDEEECFIDATFVMGRRRRGRTDQAWKRHENHGDRGSPRLAARGQHPRREPSRSAPRTIVLRLLHGRENLIGDRAYVRPTSAAGSVARGAGLASAVSFGSSGAARSSRCHPDVTRDRAGHYRRELPWLRSTRLPRCPLQAILR